MRELTDFSSVQAWADAVGLTATREPEFEAVAWVDVTEEGEIVAVHPVADPCRANQTIVTLPDGQQVAIFGADLTGARVLHRNGPGSTWGAEIPRAHPADREGHRGSVHHGSW